MGNNINELEISDWLKSWISNETGLPKNTLSDEEQFVNFGLSSRQAISLSADLEDAFQCELDPAVAWEYPTIARLSSHIYASLSTGV